MPLNGVPRVQAFEAGGTLAFGQVREHPGAQLAAVPAQVIGGVSDYFVQALAGGEDVVFGTGAGEKGVAIEEAAQDAAFGADRLECLVGPGIWVSVSVPPDQDDSESPIHKRLKNG